MLQSLDSRFFFYGQEYASSDVEMLLLEHLWLWTARELATSLDVNVFFNI